MSKWGVGAIAALDLASAKTVALGGNIRLYLAPVNAKRIGIIKATADDVGVWIPDPDTAITVAGANLVAVVHGPVLKSTTDGNHPLITLAITDAGDVAAVVATATFQASSIAKFQGDYYQKGYSVDIAVTGDVLVKTIDSLSSIANVVKGSEISIYELPVAADFTLVTQTDTFRMPSTSRDPLNVAAGLNSSAFTVAGPSPVPDVNFTQKFLTNEELVQRLAGSRATLMAEIWKDDLVMSDRIMFTEAILNWDLDAGEGASPASRNTRGTFKDALFFFSNP